MSFLVLFKVLSALSINKLIMVVVELVSEVAVFQFVIPPLLSGHSQLPAGSLALPHIVSSLL